MDRESCFVGSVAFAIGTIALVAAITNRDVYFQLPKLQWLERRWGRSVVRGVCAVLGLTFQVLGIAIILGFRRGR